MSGLPTRGPLDDPRALVAVDLGAQSCRVSLLRWTAEGPHIDCVYRIPNAPRQRNGELRWDLSMLCAAAEEGLRRCAEIAREGVAAIGITGWAVDYVRLDPEGIPIADPFCYRDPRTAPAMAWVHERIPPERLYALTGIQVLSINTLYQLAADNLAGIPGHFRWLNLPEYLLYRWGARPVAEATNASHTALMELSRGGAESSPRWCAEIFDAAGLDISAAPEIVRPGSIVGRLQGPLSRLPALRDALLLAPACHDTASAIAGIPATGKDLAFISSGTWSLVGTLLDQPCAGPLAARHNFTNEGGVGNTICFLRNVNGLWLLNQCMEAWNAAGDAWTPEALIAAAGNLPKPESLLDVDDPELLQPGRMPEKIAARWQRPKGEADGRDMPSAPQVVSILLHSLAARYGEVLRQAEMLTGRTFQRICIVGGGSKNALLNRLTEQATGLEVICGASESATLGNFAVQLAVLSKLPPKEAPSHEEVSSWAGHLAQVPMEPEAALSA